MPNVMLFGYEGRKVDELKDRIDTIMSELGLSEEAVITEIPGSVTSCDGKRTNRPFLRLATTDPAEGEQIINAFRQKKLGEDVEWEILHKFFPADELS